MDSYCAPLKIRTFKDNEAHNHCTIGRNADLPGYFETEGFHENFRLAEKPMVFSAKLGRISLAGVPRFYRGTSRRAIFPGTSWECRPRLSAMRHFASLKNNNEARIICGTDLLTLTTVTTTITSIRVHMTNPKVFYTLQMCRFHYYSFYLCWNNRNKFILYRSVTFKFCK